MNESTPHAPREGSITRSVMSTMAAGTRLSPEMNGAGTLRVPYAVLLAAFVLLSPLAANAAPAIERVQLGFQGHYKLGYWTPLHVDVRDLHESTQWSLEVIVPDSDGVPTRVRHPFKTAGAAAAVAAAAVTERLYVKIGRGATESFNPSRMIVVLRDGDREIARRSFDLAGGELPAALASDARLLVALGTTRHLAATLAANKQFKEAGARVVTITDAADLPNQWYGYEGVDLVLFSGSAAELPTLLSAEAPMAALDGWLRRGGTLLMTLGDGGKTALAPLSRAMPWAPGGFDRIVPMNNAGALEGATTVKSPLQPQTRGLKFSLPSTRLKSVDGDVMLTAGEAEGNLPLIVDRRYGFGRVLFVAFDFDDPLLGRWTGTGPLVTGLFLPPRVTAEDETSSTLGEVSHAGYDDLSGQLRSALDQFHAQGVRLLPFGALMGLFIAYIALLGPGDFLLLKRLLKRMELTWITMPLLIVLTCGGAYAVAVALKGRDVRLNQIDVVDYDDVQQVRRATSYFTIFSPRGQAYDLTLALPEATPGSAPADSGLILSWFGLPGTALGGMESRAAPPLVGAPYEYSLSLNALNEVPIPIWSTKSFIARWTPQEESPLSASLTPSQGALEGLLEGTIVNRSGERLEQCLVLNGQWAYSLGALAPGEKVTIHDGLAPRAVVGQLTRRRESDEQHDPLGTDIERIVELMSFYQTVGEQKYARLKHRYEATLDISRQLTPSRAVLIGVRRKSAAEVRNGDRSLTDPASTGGTSIFRIIVPVKPK